MTAIALQTLGLTKRFGALTAVDDLSLDVYAGEVFGFLGPNGAGKTTSIQMMCGLMRPDAGQVLIGGSKIHGGEASIRARVGVCPQETVVWDKLTLLEQCEFIGQAYGLPAVESRRRGRGLLEALGLDARAGETANRLSGGMKRRLNLVLALIHDPEIVVLDEPEAGLDPQSRVLVREYVRSLARRKTVILTTHNMDEAERLADRVAIIDRGRLLVVDTPAALKATAGEGDVLELEFADGVERAAAIARRLVQDVSMVNHTVIVRGRGLVERLPGLLNELRVANLAHCEIKLRSNTLEDVFLSLTGRRLRE